MIKERLDALRKLMKKNKLDAYIIPGTDPHQSEYVPALWQRRAWISGFNGSAGDVIVLRDKAGLWTDSRYFLQAEEQLKNSGIDLFKIGVTGVPDMIQFLKNNLEKGRVVSIDPKLHSHQEVSKMQAELQSRGITVKALEDNLVDAIWEDRPSLPDAPLFVWEDKYAGESVESKLDRIRQKMQEENVFAHVLTMLDTIAWTFNLRSSDVDYNPVFISYAIITQDNALLFVNKKKINRKVKKHLKGLAKFYDYDDFRKHLLKIAKRKHKIWLDGNTVNHWIVNLIQKKCRVFFKESPVVMFKAIKNETELQGFKNCHIRDGVAMVKFLHWLEKSVPEEGVTEITAAEKLESFRAEQDLYRGPSFETISAYGEHGAIVHYTSSPQTDVELKEEGIYLIDSGGQYLDGTTDITRTVALGEPTEEQKDRFTRVLKGHIDLAITSFPRGTQGIQLDTIARKPLWDIGLNYGHGTGHGVGAFLGVHEGPQGISYYRGLGVALEVGMICSNEPGFYKAGEYGMRIETLVNIIKDSKKSSDEDFEFYTFETATLCPIDLKLVNKDLLSEEEIAYLNDYHERVYETLLPFIKDKDLQNWLEQATKAI
ncbi:MAG TPA: aminopeptidase P family protein [Calditrichaeota bacterium]|nr:aminopeptidase P family protein [Calditrichota bacterium]